MLGTSKYESICSRVPKPAISTSNVSLTSVKHLQPLKIDHFPISEDDPLWESVIFVLENDHKLWNFRAGVNFQDHPV